MERLLFPGCLLFSPQLDTYQLKLLSIPPEFFFTMRDQLSIVQLRKYVFLCLRPEWDTIPCTNPVHLSLLLIHALGDNCGTNWSSNVIFSSFLEFFRSKQFRVHKSDHYCRDCWSFRHPGAHRHACYHCYHAETKG